MTRRQITRESEAWRTMANRMCRADDSEMTIPADTYRAMSLRFANFAWDALDHESQILAAYLLAMESEEEGR